MQRYIGTKVLNGESMSLGEYNALRGWDVPADEDPNKEGYLVEYLDGGEPNHEDYDNYISWSPKEQFENAYRKTKGANFGLAVEAMKKGMKVTRMGWNGKGMFIFLVPGSTFKVNRAPLLGIYPEGTSIDYLPYIGMKTATGEVVPWLASQTDMLADDYIIVE